jgi:hypothetical protein
MRKLKIAFFAIMQKCLKTKPGPIHIEVSAIINFAWIFLFRTRQSMLECSTRVYFACVFNLFIVVHPDACIFSYLKKFTIDTH